MNDNINLNEFLQTINGIEEQHVEAKFGNSLGGLAQKAEQGDVFRLMRAVVFLDYMRDGMNIHDAYNNTMLLTIKQVTDRVSTESDDEEASFDLDSEDEAAPGKA